jgi:hypothetical protein
MRQFGEIGIVNYGTEENKMKAAKAFESWKSLYAFETHIG